MSPTRSFETNRLIGKLNSPPNRKHFKEPRPRIDYLDTDFALLAAAKEQIRVLTINPRQLYRLPVAVLPIIRRLAFPCDVLQP